MKIKTLKIFLLIFAYFLISGCFQSDEKLIMKCADIKFEKFIGVYEEGEKTSSEILYGNNLKERFDTSDNYDKSFYFVNKNYKESKLIIKVSTKKKID